MISNIRTSCGDVLIRAKYATLDPRTGAWSATDTIDLVLEAITPTHLVASGTVWSRRTGAPRRPKSDLDEWLPADLLSELDDVFGVVSYWNADIDTIPPNIPQPRDSKE